MVSGFQKVFPFAVIAASLWLTANYLLPAFLPFLLGALLALAAEPAVAFLCRRLRLPRAAASGIGVSCLFALLCAAVAALLTLAFRELAALAGILPDMEDTILEGLEVLKHHVLHLAQQIPGSLRPLVQRNITEAFSGGTALLDQATRYALGFAGTLLGHLPDSALSMGTCILSAFLISAKLPRIQEAAASWISGSRRLALLDWGRKLRSTAGLWLLAQCKLTGITFCIVLPGLLLLRIPHSFVWAAGVSAVDAFPILGTGTVLLPWSLVAYLQGDPPRALGLLGIYLTVSLIRSMLEPRLIGRQLGLDPLVTLMAMYSGFRLWGFGGMLFAPLAAITAIRMLENTPGSAGAPA